MVFRILRNFVLWWPSFLSIPIPSPPDPPNAFLLARRKTAKGNVVNFVRFGFARLFSVLVFKFVEAGGQFFVVRRFSAAEGVAGRTRMEDPENPCEPDVFGLVHDPT